MAISGRCKKVTTTMGRVMYGTNPRIGNLSRCGSGSNNSLIFDCPAYDTSLKNEGWCLYSGEGISTIESVDDSICGACVQTIVKYDCINGNCVNSTQYNTSGLYNSLEDCQNNCGSSNNNSCPDPYICIDPSNYCPPDKVCIDNTEWSQINSLIQQNLNKHCNG